MAERIPTDMDAFLREHAARATPLPEVREAALARWPHSPDADDDQRRAHAARIETAYKHRRKHARDAARAALTDFVPALESVAVASEALADAANEFTARKMGDGVSASVDGIVSPGGSEEIQIAPSRQTVKIDSVRTDAAPLSRENLQVETPQAIAVRSDVERLEGVVDNLATQVGRLADAVSQMLAQAQDVAAAKDALIETQRRYVEHLQRMVGT